MVADFFDYVSGRKEPPDGQERPVLSIRVSTIPNSEIVEDVLQL